jgi:ligand-binding SRPBCC domain-containing protein
MSIHTFTASQFIPSPVKTVWDFFSSPANLSLITPPEMKFKILSDQTASIYNGQRIRYKVSPFSGLTVNWVTEIVDVDAHHSFTDIQSKGPYKIWRHRHVFYEEANGTRMTDEVNYEIGYGPFGNMLLPLIKKRIETIFDYRKTKIIELFPHQQ